MLPWAVGARGEAPDDPAARREWQRRASAIGAYRELSGHHDPAEAIGPEPPANNPDLRAACHEALAASYQALRDSYRTRETALATAMDDRTAWDRATRQQRQLAVAADAELRHRHPNQPWPSSAPPNPSP